MLTDKIQADTRIEHIAEIDGGRLLIRIPVHLIQTHRSFSKIRHKDPKSVSLLRDSVKQSGNEPIYPICLYAEADSSGGLNYYITDGHQRLRSLRELQQETTVAQVITRWTSVQEAMSESISLGWARYQMKEDDILSIMQTSILGNKEVAELTGKSESVISRIGKVAKHTWMHPMIREGAFNYTVAGQLIDAAASNVDKLEALQNALEPRFQDAQKQVKEWQYRFRTDKKRDWRSYKDKVKISTYFKDIEWSSWVFALEAGGEECLERNEHNQLVLKVDETKKKKPVMIGNANEWNKQYALSGLFERRIEDVLIEDLETVVDRWDEIGEKLVTILQRRRYAEASVKYKMPPSNPEAELSKSDTPKEQFAGDMEIDSGELSEDTPPTDTDDGTVRGR